MARSKTTKRALVASVCATLMCIAMLIGTTFAWFTDTASTSVNKIQSGTLDVTLEQATEWNTETGAPTTWATAEGQTLTFRTADNRAATSILWEPGCTYSLPELRISNNGNLALKYKIIISGIEGNAELNKVIDWTITNDADSTTTDLSTTEYKLNAKSGDTVDSDILTIKGHMQETAGNEYQDETIDGIAITVIATQDTVEYDSNSNDYDANAEYPVVAVTQVAVGDGQITTAAASIKSVETIGDTTTPIAAATIPSGVKTTATEGDTSIQLKLTIDKAAVPANFTYNAAENDAATLEVKMEGLATDNEKPITVTMYVGTNLSGFELYHNNTAMTSVTNAESVSNDQDYYYNSDSGFVTMATKSFSPFTYTCKKDSWVNHAATDYATTTDTTNKIVTVASAEELALFAKTASQYSDGYTVNITADIDLGAYLWVPMSVSGVTINGGGHTISNMLVRSCVTAGSSRYGTGFIGSTNKITVKSLAFNNANVDFADYATSNSCGLHCGNQGAVVVGRTYGPATFENVSVANSTIYGYGKIGCLLGHADGGVSVTFKNCVSKDNTICAEYNIGGLAGHIQRSNGVDNTTVTNCTVENITVDYNSYYNGESKGSGTYIDLNNATATFKSNDKKDGTDVSKVISGKYWVFNNYYWGAYADYYVSYGHSSYDAPVANYSLKIANSEYCVNK